MGQQQKFTAHPSFICLCCSFTKELINYKIKLKVSTKKDLLF